MPRDKSKREKVYKKHATSKKYKILKEVSESDVTTGTVTDEVSPRYLEKKDDDCTCRKCMKGLYTKSGRMIVISSPVLFNHDVKLDSLTTETETQTAVNSVKINKSNKCSRKSEKHRREKKSRDETEKRKSKTLNKLKSVDPCCPLCTKPFYCPILLSCAHTFCKDCVTVFVETSEGKEFPCPVCSTRISLTGTDEELFCPNFMILKTIESDEPDDKTCTVCDLDQEARYICENCSDLLCHECKDRHKVVKSTKDHSIKRLTPDTDTSSAVKKRYFCTEHNKEQLLLHCVQCQQSVCRECALVYHHGDKHNCIPIDDASMLYRELLQRKLYSLKSRSPSLQLSLMDVKRIKKLLKDQVKVVREEISDSIKRLVSALKDRERKLYQNVNQAYRMKTNRLKEQRKEILLELEQFEVASRTIQQLEQHDNNIEMLQMKATIENSLRKLEQPVNMFELEQDTILLKSHEKSIKDSVEKHGEIIQFFDECQNKGSQKINSDKSVKHEKQQNAAIIVSDFEDSSSSVGGSVKGDICLNVRRLRAKANWKLLKTRVPDIINYGKTIYNTRLNLEEKLSHSNGKHSCLSPRTTTLSKSPEKCGLPPLPPKQHSKIKNETASDVAIRILQKKFKNPKRRSPAVIKKETVAKLPLEIYKQAKVERAHSNWLILKSRLYDIVDYGRIVGKLPFNPLVPTSRYRESLTILRLRYYRATVRRAQANWKILSSKINSIDKLKQINSERKTLWHEKLKTDSDEVTASTANWNIVRSRLKDINFYGKYERFNSSKHEQKSSYSPNMNKSHQRLDSLEAKSNWDVLMKPKKGDKEENKSLQKLTDNLRRKSLTNWEKLIEKIDDVQISKTTRPMSTENLVKLKQAKSTKTKISRSNSLNNITNDSIDNWKKLIQGMQQNNSPEKAHDSYSDWNVLINKAKSNCGNNHLKDLDKVKKPVGNDPVSNWDALLGDNFLHNEKTANGSKSSNNINQTKKPSDSYTYWNVLIDENQIENDVKSIPDKIQDKKNSNQSKTNYNVMINNENENSYEDWDLLIKNDIVLDGGSSTPVKKVKSKIPRLKKKIGKTQSKSFLSRSHSSGNVNIITSLKHWDKLIHSGIPVRKKKLNKSVVKRAISAPDLTENTVDEDEAFKNWLKVMEKDNGANLLSEEETLENWKCLLEGKINGTIKNNDREAFKNWKKLMRVKNSKNNEALENWAKLIDGKMIPKPKEANYKLDKKSHETSLEQWNELLNSTADDTQAFLYWEKLLEGKINRDKPRPLSQLGKSTPKKVELQSPAISQSSVKSKSSVLKSIKAKIVSRTNSMKSQNTSGSNKSGSKVDISSDGWGSLIRDSKEAKLLTLKVKDSKDVFQEVNVKITSPDKSILSAHVADNADGTFTIFCCPTIENDFNMFVTLHSDQFQKDHQVVNIYGRFDSMKKRERDLACKTVSLMRWHLTPGLLTKRGDRVVGRKENKNID